MTSANFVFAWLGGAAGVVALVVSLLSASSWRRYCVIVVAGLILTVAAFGGVLLTSSTNPSHPDCSDCSNTWGRWWEPAFVVFVLALNFAGWVVGATIGRLLRQAGGRLARS